MKYSCISPSTPQMVELATQREDRDGCVFFLIKLSLGWWFWASSLIGLPNFNDFMNPCDQNRKQAEYILNCTSRLLKLSPHPFLASAHNCNSFHSDPAARCRHAAVKRTMDKKYTGVNSLIFYHMSFSNSVNHISRILSTAVFGL